MKYIDGIKVRFFVKGTWSSATVPCCDWGKFQEKKNLEQHGETGKKMVYSIAVRKKFPVRSTRE